MTNQTCAACNKFTVEGGTYCTYHSQALEALKIHFNTWKESYESPIPWEEFLVMVSKRKEMGRWIKEVADAERKK